MKHKQEILQKYLEGVSKRKIARLLKVSRNTVDKYIREFEESRKQDVRNLPITEDIMKPPTYKGSKRKRRVLTEEMMKIIRKSIKENEWKRKNNISKQQMKIIDIHEKLLNEGFSISYTTVRNFVNEEAANMKEVFIRKNSMPSEEVEFDWGEVKLKISGKIKSYSLGIFTLPNSNYRFAKLYASEAQVCVLDIHARFIENIDFVPSTFTYDNMRTVVRSFIGNERTITDSMKNLSNYYQFKIRLCEPRKGNQKGHVERSVEFIRRKAFADRFTFSTIEEAEKHLGKVLLQLNNRIHHEKKVSHIELMKQEKLQSSQQVVPSPFDASELFECRVDKYSTVMVKQNHYSVPEGHVGQWIKVKAGAETIKLFIGGTLVAQHRRSWGIHQWEMNIYHYLKTFEKKKGALSQSECLKQAPKKIKQIYKDYYIGKEKEFIDLLFYVRTHQNLDVVQNAIDNLKSLRQDFVTTERILFLCEQSSPLENKQIECDDTIRQSEQNIQAYFKMFKQIEEGVNHDEPKTTSH